MARRSSCRTRNLAEPRREFHDSDVARPANHVGERRAADVVLVVDLAPVDLIDPVARVHRILICDATAVDQPRRHERLGRRPGLERVRDDSGRRLLGIEPPAGHRANGAGVRIEHDNVAALGAHSRHGIDERAIGDLLQVGVDREHDAVAFHRRRPRFDRRLSALAVRVAHHRRRSRLSAKDGIERELEAVHSFVVRVDVTDEPLRSRGHSVLARDHRERVDAAQRDRRSGVDSEKLLGHGEVLGRRVHRASDQRRIDSQLRERRFQLARLPHFARRDLQADGLAALREDAVRRVHDVAARRGDDALGGLLARGACAPSRALHELDVGGLE